MNVKDIKNYLQTCSDMFNKKSVEYVYLTEGREFSNQPLSPVEETDLLGLLARGTYTQKECWYNASVLAVSNQGLTFCEGYAVRDKLPIPIQHAWVTFKGRAIDVTWGNTYTVRSPKNILARIRNNIAYSIYFGVEITYKELSASLCETDVYDSPVLHRLIKSLTSVKG